MQSDEPEDAFYARMVKSKWAYRDPRDLRPDMPLRQVQLIARCLSPRVTERVPDADAMAYGVTQLYARVPDVLPIPKTTPTLFSPSEAGPKLVAKGIRHRPPPEIPSLADTLNNQAVSLVDLGREEDALRLLDEALRVEPTHSNATFNRGIHPPL